MPTTYPPPTPTISGDTVTINRFLNSPTAVNRRVQELTQYRFIADVLLQGRYPSNGSVRYEIDEALFTDRPVEAVSAGAEYPRATAGHGTEAFASVTKWGQDVPITDEAIGRQLAGAVEKKMRQVANTIVRQVDNVALTVINAAVTQTQAAAAAWTSASANPFRDVQLAKAQVAALDKGFEPETLVMSDMLYALLTSNDKVIAGLSREGSNQVTATGEILRLADLELLRTSRLPAGTNVLLVDRQMLGGIAFERIPSPEYTGDPANGVETWARRDPDANDQWLLRGRRPVVPVVLEPGSAIKITGAL